MIRFGSVSVSCCCVLAATGREFLSSSGLEKRIIAKLFHRRVWSLYHRNKALLHIMLGTIGSWHADTDFLLRSTYYHTYSFSPCSITTSHSLSHSVLVILFFLIPFFVIISLHSSCQARPYWLRNFLYLVEALVIITSVPVFFNSRHPWFWFLPVYNRYSQ